MRKRSGPPAENSDRCVDGLTDLSAAWRDLGRQARQTRVAIRRNACELDAIYRWIHMRSRIRSLEREMVRRRLAEIARAAEQDPNLGEAANVVRQAIEAAETAAAGRSHHLSEGVGSDREAFSWCA